ncbi:MAG: hypothetical protein N3E40_03950, partial [Dehalococcoidia bacterium]|nr:hypothetical protein [Dehalococcoidia bacterium]
RYLTRLDGNKSTYNRVLGRLEPKHQGLLNPKDQISRWLAGSQQESKKVFSFKKPARTFGFVKPGLVDFSHMKERLSKVWPGFRDEEFLEGSIVLEKLLQRGGQK